MHERPAYYITTPIYYVNDRPHVGSCYTTLLADAAARFMRAAGRDVFFLTGTDEHGQKVEKSAAEKGLTPKALADENAAHFQAAFRFLGCSFDHFIRTTDPAHERQVQEALRRLIASGDIYLGTFEGWYDEGQEEYVTENQARERNYKAFNGQPLVKAKEENYYFRLSAYQARLEEFFARNPGFVRPEARRNEVLGRMKEGLQDVPVSRTSFRWGVPFPPEAPGAEKHVTYVWIDALFNYITALGVMETPPPSSKTRTPPPPGMGEGGSGGIGARARFWPADVHAIGKEILWFHAVIWPALLMALRLDIPACVYAHSFWIREGKKMSKSLGNFIDMETIQAYCSVFGVDAWRWFMLTQGPIEATDADFSHAKFVEVYNADLANGVGNAFSRVANMIEKYFDGKCPAGTAPIHAGHDWPAITGEAVRKCMQCFERFAPGEGLTEAMALTKRVDGYIHATEPFKLARDGARLAEVGTILHNAAEALRIAAVLLSPAMPGKMSEVLQRTGQTPPDEKGRFSKPLKELSAWGGLKPGTAIVKGEALFPRADPKASAPGG